MADEAKSAGWYPDPDGAAGERWWNGAGWSDSRRGGAAGAASTPYGPDATTSAAPEATAPGASVPAVPVPAVPIPETDRTTPIIYSAENPAPQRPDPYAQSYPAAPVRATTSVNVSVNRNAMIGFVTGLVALFANILYLLGPVSIVFSALGLVKARQLRAQGVTGNLMIFAVIGLASGAIATIIGFVSIVAGITGLFGDS